MSADRWINYDIHINLNLYIHIHMEQFSVLKWSGICKNMDEPRAHYINCNSQTERKTLYDLNNIRNLINL